MILQCGTLRVVFLRQGDRFAHRIEALEDGQFTLAYESVEGNEQSAWPPSPPLQSVHLEPRDDGRLVALLVGMAGRSHWSASAEADPATGRITFDVACRVQEEPSWLGSTYRAFETLHPAGERHFQTPLPPGEGRVRVAPLALNADQSAPVAILKRAGSELVLAAPMAPGPLPRTIRWRYVISRD